ncbi:TonB-dependent receptor [Desulfonema limicola]|uniref:TonB-dependent receptor n=1 Tax=Desulfonema limicola TaxID=45656 RepID=A0A975B5X2_9BACT|nr:TonB-dependent receptor [Desulfonema limicola]QTA79411.1 TonB-dependent receptor [Desulfonema limicola]
MVKYIKIFIILIFSFASISFASISFASVDFVLSQEYPLSSVYSEIDEELKWLKEEAVETTEIATKTKMDADLVPGMVTILSREQLEKQGIRTVFEALPLVPGITTLMTGMGEPIVSVRGIGGTFFSGNMKLMLDGVAMNEALSAAGYALYQIPVEQIERIEIIRGPGSVIYGEYAYAGVINVITRKTGNRIFAGYDTNKGYGGGAAAAYSLPEKDFNISLSMAGWKTDGPDVQAGEDRLYGMGLGYFSNSPGSTNEFGRDKMANLSLEYKDFSAKGQYLSTERGDYYGIIGILPVSEDRSRQLNQHMAFEANQRLNFFSSLTTDLKAGFRNYEFEIDDIVALPPITIPLPDGSIYQMTPPDGSIAGPYYEERELYAGTEFIWDGINNNTILLGLKYSDIKMEDVWVDTNTGDMTPGVMTRLTGEYNWLLEDQSRKVFSVYLQDLYRITDNFTLTPGLRYDNYNDMGEYITPRLSAVWQPAKSHILKAQYSEAYRPPTFTELYARQNSVVMGNSELEAEHIRSYELGYTFRLGKTAAHITLFRSELTDNIEYPVYADPFAGEAIQYQNADETITSQGVELEFNHNLMDDLAMNLNISFADTNDSKTDEPITGAVDWLGNLGLVYRPANYCTLGFKYNYVGKRHRTPDDSRGDIDAYDSVDLTGIITHKGLTWGAGITNIFNSNIVYPAPVYKDESGNMGYTYEEDFQRPGRKFWVRLSYDF